MAEITVTDQNFEEEVEKAEGLVLVDFWAPWCMPCQMLGPTIEEIAKDYEGKVKVCKLNVDEAQQTSMKCGIQGIPNVKFFKDGKVVEDLTGLRPKGDYEEVIKRLTE